MMEKIFANSAGAAARSLRIFGRRTERGNRRERFADTAQIFVGKNREHERRLLITKNFAPRLRQNARRAGIMRAVDDGALIPFLKTSRPFDRRKSAHNRFFAELDVRGVNRGDCYCGILFLVFTTQSYWRPVVSLIYELHWRTAFSSSRANDFFGLRLLRRGNDRNAWFDNSCFFTGDLSQCVSEPLFMIEIDRSND